MTDSPRYGGELWAFSPGIRVDTGVVTCGHQSDLVASFTTHDIKCHHLAESAHSLRGKLHHQVDCAIWGYDPPAFFRQLPPAPQKHHRVS